MVPASSKITLFSAKLASLKLSICNKLKSRLRQQKQQEQEQPATTLSYPENWYETAIRENVHDSAIDLGSEIPWTPKSRGISEDNSEIEFLRRTQTAAYEKILSHRKSLIEIDIRNNYVEEIKSKQEQFQKRYEECQGGDSKVSSQSQNQLLK
jgi:hypothetical protein